MQLNKETRSNQTTIWFYEVLFYGISTIDGHFMQNPLYTYILIYMICRHILLVWFGLVCWVLWHINLCRLFNAKSIFM